GPPPGPLPGRRGRPEGEGQAARGEQEGGGGPPARCGGEPLDREPGGQGQRDHPDDAQAAEGGAAEEGEGMEEGEEGRQVEGGEEGRRAASGQREDPAAQGRGPGEGGGEGEEAGVVGAQLVEVPRSVPGAVARAAEGERIDEGEEEAGLEGGRLAPFAA